MSLVFLVSDGFAPPGAASYMSYYLIFLLFIIAGCVGKATSISAPASISVQHAHILRIGTYLQREQAQQEAEEQRRANMNSDERDEEDIMQQRYWDDFKDTHPRGYGNSKLKPCG